MQWTLPPPPTSNLPHTQQKNKEWKLKTSKSYIYLFVQQNKRSRMSRREILFYVVGIVQMQSSLILWEWESEIERYNAIQCEKSVLFAPFFTFTWSFKCIFGHSPFVAELFCIAPSSRTDLSFVVRYTKLLDIHSLVYVCVYMSLSFKCPSGA